MYPNYTWHVQNRTWVPCQGTALHKAIERIHDHYRSVAWGYRLDPIPETDPRQVACMVGEWTLDHLTTMFDKSIREYYHWKEFREFGHRKEAGERGPTNYLSNVAIEYFESGYTYPYRSVLSPLSAMASHWFFGGIGNDTILQQGSSSLARQVYELTRDWPGYRRLEFGVFGDTLLVKIWGGSPSDTAD